MLKGDSLEFHSVHFYADELASLCDYKKLESQFNQFAENLEGCDVPSLELGAQLYSKISGVGSTSLPDPSAYKSSGQDLVRQLISGLGFRITGAHQGVKTSTVILTTRSRSEGVQFVITAPNKQPPAKVSKFDAEDYKHFGIEDLNCFSENQAGRQGVAVLCFKGNDVAQICQQYKKTHPALLATEEPLVYMTAGGCFEIVEVYAYYKADSSTFEATSEADFGTRLRFIEFSGSNCDVVLPGVEAVDATFPKDAPSAWNDHWVSNVVDRKSFLKTLDDTLGFTPKVDFNAGVVAAGEAIIESTVCGNTPKDFAATSITEVLQNQQQIFLPINNALSKVGHVHLYLQEIGQGVQHIASRVQDLPSFVQRVNDYRKMTGEGMTFLKIPQSYYGFFTPEDLASIDGVDEARAKRIYQELKSGDSPICGPTGDIKLDVTEAEILRAAPSATGDHSESIVTAVRRARYNNLYSLLGDNFSEESYLKIVRNHILVDIQAGDILFQIFTATVLQREPGLEAPFLEFIQRVCSEKKGPDGKSCPLRPGCGGFGIRNFLTLFLSIELSKATLEAENLRKEGNVPAAMLFEEMVQVFTNQLHVSNPVLTKIADAMTLEADSLQEAKHAKTAEAKAKALACAETHRTEKEAGNLELQAISESHRLQMVALRQKNV
ncbi:hypothetical protein CYMTET_37162 [Cymbomonas tetramitiformis]|uniref:4-hydroxyphenylpyruvate dioxygenase n=1 Tax=Cymbomonas tetramitiformis TaxID=36881 RepID=A0AAE0CFU3_9CHLO|nr:hypothetical protein CYMTET_37162 [Cymbomonas tetramitiformis]